MDRDQDKWIKEKKNRQTPNDILDNYEKKEQENEEKVTERNRH